MYKARRSVLPRILWWNIISAKLKLKGKVVIWPMTAYTVEVHSNLDMGWSTWLLCVSIKDWLYRRNAFQIWNGLINLAEMMFYAVIRSFSPPSSSPARTIARVQGIMETANNNFNNWNNRIWYSILPYFRECTLHTIAEIVQLLQLYDQGAWASG